MAKLVVEGSDNVSVSQLKELHRQLEDAILNGRHLQALLEHRDPFEETSFKLLGSFKIGTHKNADTLMKAMKKEDFKISDWAEDMMKQPTFTVVSSESEILLAEISVGDLGFKKGATYKEICERAVGMKMEHNGETYTVALCPAEAGPQFRLQYKNQPKGEWLRIAMEPITGSDGDRYLFRVAHFDRGQWLDWDDGGPGYFWSADYRFVWQLCK